MNITLQLLKYYPVCSNDNVLDFNNYVITWIDFEPDA